MLLLLYEYNIFLKWSGIIKELILCFDTFTELHAADIDVELDEVDQLKALVKITDKCRVGSQVSQYYIIKYCVYDKNTSRCTRQGMYKELQALVLSCQITWHIVPTTWISNIQ